MIGSSIVSVRALSTQLLYIVDGLYKARPHSTLMGVHDGLEPPSSEPDREHASWIVACVARDLSRRN